MTRKRPAKGRRTEKAAWAVHIPRWFPGEENAVATVKALGAEYGYGNLIHHLKDAWSERLQKSGLPKKTADVAAGHICVWCYVDSRTGKKVPKRTPKGKVRNER